MAGPACGWLRSSDPVPDNLVARDYQESGTEPHKSSVRPTSPANVQRIFRSVTAIRALKACSYATQHLTRVPESLFLSPTKVRSDDAEKLTRADDLGVLPELREMALVARHQVV